MRKKKLKPIPKFKSEKEEVEFWDTHDTTDYFDWSTAEVLKPGTFQRSPRCPKDDMILLTRYIDVEIAGGQVVLRHVPQLYCREGHFTRYVERVERQIRVIEAVLAALELQTEVEPQAVAA